MVFKRRRTLKVVQKQIETVPDLDHALVLVLAQIYVTSTKTSSFNYIIFIVQRKTYEQ